MNKLIAPCKGCKDRIVGCHSTCEKYLTYRAEKTKENGRRRTEASQERVQYEIERERKKKMATGKFGRHK